MTNLIVRPIDDDRYSAFSKALYLMNLSNHAICIARNIAKVDHSRALVALLKSRNREIERKVNECLSMKIGR